MFISQPQFEFRFPIGLKKASERHWRMFELALDAPWFLLTVERVDRTLCIGWEPDLINLLRSHPAVLAIACLMPASQSETSRWWCRDVREVRLQRSAIGEAVVLIDSRGESFDCGLRPTHHGLIEQELLWTDPRLRSKR